ncbi:MAG TPA: glutaredoxin [Desulfotomaculum sp.]|nr:glutaredoxin [Desulfotomaculum sp.]
MEAFAKKGVAHRYLDVKTDPEALKQMLKYSEGRRAVPVIVEGDKVTVGFGGT